MSEAEWEEFIHSEAAVGSTVVIELTLQDRSIWQVMPAEIDGVPVAHFDCSIGNGAIGVVRRASYCGWLRVEVPDHGEIDCPGWYLRPAIAGVKRR